MSVTATTTQQLYWQDSTIASEFSAGVSLHSHTTCSEESLSVVPPAIAGFISWRSDFLRKRTAETTAKPDFANGFWTPPLPPRQAYRLEEKQVHAAFDLPAIVSLTDHDNIRASSLLRVIRQFRQVPISIEWSIPFGPTFFHLGIHNLDPQKAEATVAELNGYTAVPSPEKLVELLHMLNQDPAVLVVVNHPLWDEKGIGLGKHQATLLQLLAAAGALVHALEANGLRSLAENNRVVQLGAELNLPVVAGGDRHGLEPNAILNLCHGRTLADFIAEVRYDRRSHMVYMPQFRQSRFLRILHMVTDVVRDYPNNFEGRRTFADRIFYRKTEGAAPVSFSSVYGEHSLSPVKHFLTAMQVVDRRPASAILTNA